MKISSILVLAIVVIMLTASTVQADLVATVSTSATYQTIADSDSDTSFDPAIPAEAHAYAGVDDWDYARGEALAEIGGSVKASSAVVGASGGALSASANSSQTTKWLITSETLSIGTPISVLIDISFNGQLARSRNVNSTSANACLVLDETELLYEAGGNYGSEMVSSGAWTDDFSYKQDFDIFLRYYVLDTTDRISFNAEVGQIIDLELLLQTNVIVPDALEDGALADFFNSGSYTFGGAEDPANPGMMLDVSFTVVPEPTTILLLGLGVVLLRKRR